MSELKPCPVCGGSIVCEGRDQYGSERVWCSNTDCEFDCTANHWNLLPRTNWVSVDERLPMVNELYFVRFGGDTYGCTTYIFSEAGFHEDGVTHWLDNLPPIPTGKDQ